MKKWICWALCAVLLLGCLPGCSTEEDGKYVIGICQLAVHDALDAATQGFMDTIKEELGEENVRFVSQNAAGDPNTCSTIINSFVSQNVDLILANATAALQAATAATADIPILGTSVTEYGVALNIKDFSGTVGGNISGTSDLAPLDQQAAMIKAWCPDAKNVGLLYCSAEPNSKYQVETIAVALKALGYECKEYPFADSSDMQAVTQTAAANSDVIYIPTDNTAATGMPVIDSICRPANVPVFPGEESMCRNGGVATLSISYYDLGVATGKMAVKILKGEADISTMPIEYVSTFSKKYNKQIAEDLGLTAPEGFEALN